MDLARAADQIDALIEKRARGNEAANAEEELWRSSVRKHSAKIRRRHRAEWFCYFSNLADALRKSADEFDARAAALLEDVDERKEKL